MKRAVLIIAGLSMLLVSCTRKPEALVIPDFSITAPPEELGLPDFYKKYILLESSRQLFRRCTPHALRHDFISEAGNSSDYDR